MSEAASPVGHKLYVVGSNPAWDIVVWITVLASTATNHVMCAFVKLHPQAIKICYLNAFPAN